MTLQLNITLSNAVPFNADMQQGLVNALAHVTGSSGVATNVTGFSTSGSYVSAHCACTQCFDACCSGRLCLRDNEKVSWT